MTSQAFKPVLYLKQNCPYCLKIRIFLLEAGMAGQVEIRDFAPGTDEETAIRAELAPHMEKISFPVAQLEPGAYMGESDDIVAALAGKAGRDPAGMTVYRNYAEGVFAAAKALWQENMELKQAAAAA